MIGVILLIGALVAAGGALLAVLLPWLFRRRAGLAALLGPAGRLLTALAAIFVAGSVLHLALSLTAGDFAIRYVWQHSASYQPLAHRLSALLAGQEGTLLLWSWFAVVAALIMSGREPRQRHDPGGARLVHIILLAVVVILLIITVRSAPFDSFAEAFPEIASSAVPVEGRGLNPVLQNPWMPPHTIFTFVAYALIGISFAIGLVMLIRTGQGKFAEAKGWTRPLLGSVRWSWLALSLALLTGIIWAFEEMTFGWFWSWDPVEAATLAIWLVLTACLHAGAKEVAGRRATLVAPTLACFSLVAVVFASFVTRSGLHPSVHAFAGGAAGPYLGAWLLFLVASLVLCLNLAWRRATDDDGRKPLSYAVSPAWPLLFAGALLIMWGISYPMASAALLQRTVELDSGFFNMWGYLFAIALLLALGLRVKGAGRREDLQLFLFFALLTIIAAFVKPTPQLQLVAEERLGGAGPLYVLWGQSSILSLLPPIVYALLAVVERWWSFARGAVWAAFMRETGLAAVHVGFVVAVAGVTLSTLLATSHTISVNALSGELSSKGGVAVRILSLTHSELSDGRGVVVEQREAAAVETYIGGSLAAAGQAQLFTYPERAMGRHARVLIRRGLTADVQVIYHGSAEGSGDVVPVTVRHIPLVNLVWGGVTLLVMGLAVVMGSRLPPRATAAGAKRAVAT